MEHKIGEEFNVILRVKTNKGLGTRYDCNRCAMGSVCSGTHDSVSPCANTDRQDGIDVYFDSVSVKDENEMKQQENIPEENTKNTITNESLDLTKILKDCPKGWKFYSVVHGDVEFRRFYSLDEILFTYNKDAEYENDLVTDNYGKLVDTGECIVFPSKDQRDWSKFTAPWYNPEEQSEQKVEYWAKIERFDVSTLKPFDKVLVRDGRASNWKCKFFSHITKSRAASFVCTDSIWKHCIPYNEDTKHLANSNQDAPEYYRYWED